MDAAARSETACGLLEHRAASVDHYGLAVQQEFRPRALTVEGQTLQFHLGARREELRGKKTGFPPANQNAKPGASDARCRLAASLSAGASPRSSMSGSATRFTMVIEGQAHRLGGNPNLGNIRA